MTSDEFDIICLCYQLFTTKVADTILRMENIFVAKPTTKTFSIGIKPIELGTHYLDVQFYLFVYI